jgi:glycosyltransferase involved in cell wall biosynthesis
MDKDLRFGGLAAKLAGVPRIIPSREIDYPLKDTLRYRFFYNSIATRIVMNSKATLQTVTESAPWFNRSRAIIIYKGIDLRPYDKKTASTVRQDLAIKKSSPIVTFVGQLDERKGIHYLLDAWRLVTKHHPKAVLLMAGKGKMVDFIRRYIKGFSLESSIVLAGFRADIPALLRDSSMLVLPSLWEGFGYVLVEAMAASLPTVATKTSSIPEIVIDGETGILVPPKESRPLAKAIDTLLDSPKMRKKMGRAGRRVVEEKFTIDRMVDDFERIFRE